MIAGLRPVPEIHRQWLRLVLVVGPAVFLTVGFAGFFLPNGFLSYPAQFTKPLIIVIEVVLTLSIAARHGPKPPTRKGAMYGVGACKTICPRYA